MQRSPFNLWFQNEVKGFFEWKRYWQRNPYVCVPSINDKLVTFVLIHQDDKKKCYRRSFNDTQKQKDTWTSFQKPVTDVNTAVGLQDYITLEKLRSDGFIKNDILYIRTFIK